MKTDAPALILMLAAALAAPGSALAQEPVRSFDQLNTRLKPGDTVYVTDAQGREIKGTLRELTPSALTLDHDGPQTVPADAVRVVERRTSRPVKKGALWGLVIGGALAVGVVIDGVDDSECADDCGTWAVMAPVAVGLGVGAGAGIGAMIPGKKRIVYQAPGSARGARLSVTPVIAARAKGVTVSFAF